MRRTRYWLLLFATIFAVLSALGAPILLSVLAQRRVVLAVGKLHGNLGYDCEDPKVSRWRYELSNRIGMQYVGNIKSVLDIQCDDSAAAASLLTDCQALPSLKYLTLRGVVGADVIEKVGHLPGIEILTFESPHGEHLDPLRNLTKLFLLELEGLKTLSPAAIDAIAEIPNLTHLRLENAEFEPGALATLCKCKQLLEVDLMGAKISCDDLRQLADAPGLKIIMVNSETIGGGLEGIEALKNAMPDLWFSYPEPPHTSGP